VRRKFAKRSESWYQDTAAPLSTPARKKRRLTEPLLPPPTVSDEADRKTASPNASVGLPPPVAIADPNADPVTDTQPNGGANSRWRLDEDALLISAFTNTRKNKFGKERRVDWIAIAALVPGRTRTQCRYRWVVLDPSIDRANGRAGKWKEDEDTKLKDAVETHGDKDWVAVAAMIPGRTRIQCYKRWLDALNPNIEQSNGCTGRTKWKADEDSKLTDAVKMHGDKDWVKVAALIPGRTRKSCWKRWTAYLDPSIDRRATERTGKSGKWTGDEIIQLEVAIQMHGGKNWGAIAALVPGRGEAQCWGRWKRGSP
jgi:hypothetical protein